MGFEASDATANGVICRVAPMVLSGPTVKDGLGGRVSLRQPDQATSRDHQRLDSRRRATWYQRDLDALIGEITSRLGHELTTILDIRDPAKLIGDRS